MTGALVFWIVLVALVVLTVGTSPVMPWSFDWGWGGTGTFALILAIWILGAATKSLKL